VDIRGRLELYGFSVDAQRWDLFDRIFARDDLRMRHGDNKPYISFEDFVTGFDRIHREFDITRHSMSNFIVEVDGDRARSITYGQWRLVKFDCPGGDCWTSEGWYEDQWIRTGEGWRITRRQSWELWGEGNPAIIGVDQAQFDARRRPLADAELARSLLAG
jgi:hypothetical protein